MTAGQFVEALLLLLAIFAMAGLLKLYILWLAWVGSLTGFRPPE